MKDGRVETYRCIWCNRKLNMPDVHECPSVPKEWLR